MKSKTLLILTAVVLVLLAYVYFYEFKGKAARAEAKEKAGQLVDVAVDDVRAVTFKKEDGSTIAFKKDDQGVWALTQPLAATAEEYEVSSFVETFAGLKPDRTVDEAPADLAAYEIPRMEVVLELKDNKPPVKILIGMENPLDQSHFAKREDQAKVVLLPSFLKSTFDKTVFDFRQKDVFKLETDEVKGIALRAKNVAWRAERKDAGWFLSDPLPILAKSSMIEGVLNALSDLRAKAFVAEDKTPEDVRAHKLDAPDYEVRLRLPASNQEVVFALHKAEDEKVYATTSASTKIVEVESTVLTDLEKPVDDLQEKQVAVFNSWEVVKVAVTKGEVAVTAAKDEDDKWRIETPFQAEADGEKVETFVRKIESLEAAGFVIPPVTLADDGLASPQAEVAVTVNEYGEDGQTKEREVRIVVGRADADGKRVVVKNAALDYLFWVDAEFLSAFPAKPEDWKPAPAAEETKDADKD
ncbi:MAG: DUF4340 domain-containing protein [Candidatus Aminicenantes bacterium]|nr:DUF4340 domain-containing protein [Candidatus Aminicenantes bacterium]